MPAAPPPAARPRSSPRRGRRSRRWRAPGRRSWPCRPEITPTLSVVPSSGRCNFSIARIWCASSTTALRPFSGSTPECAGRPSTVRVNRPVPLRAGLQGAVRQRRLDDEREGALPRLVLDQARERRLPISSSEVKSTTSGRGIARPSAAIAAERGLDQDQARLHVVDARSERLGRPRRGTAWSRACRLARRCRNGRGRARACRRIGAEPGADVVAANGVGHEVDPAAQRARTARRWCAARPSSAALLSLGDSCSTTPRSDSINSPRRDAIASCRARP